MRRAWTLLVAAGLTALPGVAWAQDAPRVTVRVRQVAGASLYLDVGTAHGLATGDTLGVLADSAGSALGRLVVTASTEGRSVLTFAGEPFAVARGDRITLLLLRVPTSVPAGEPAPPVPAEPPARAAPSEQFAPPPAAVATAPRARAHGRVAADLGGVRSVTRVGGADPLDIERTFATPALRVDVTAPAAVGGFTLHTSARVAYRYSSGDAVQPAASTRIYAASLERRFTSVPLRVVLGRFHSPAETYSGYWDGVLLRVGSGAVGLGAIVGFEPDQWNEGLSTELLKATVFVDGSARGAGWRWRGDLSAHTVRPSDSLPAHTFLGVTQRLTAGPLRLSHDVQTDRHPDGGSWHVSRLNARAGLEVATGVEIRVGLARRESYLLRRPDDPFATKRDRLDAGIGVRGGAGYLSADVDVSRDAAGDQTRGASLFASVYRLPGLDRIGLSGSASRWSGDYGTTLSLSPGMTLGLSRASLRVGYRYGHTDYLQRDVTSHGLDGSLDAPLAGGMRLTARGRLQWGGLLRSQALDLTLYRIF
jgi:hypothetical protein